MQDVLGWGSHIPAPLSPSPQARSPAAPIPPGPLGGRGHRWGQVGGKGARRAKHPAPTGPLFFGHLFSDPQTARAGNGHLQPTPVPEPHWAQHPPAGRGLHLLQLESCQSLTGSARALGHAIAGCTMGLLAAGAALPTLRSGPIPTTLAPVTGQLSKGHCLDRRQTPHPVSSPGQGQRQEPGGSSPAQPTQLSGPCRYWLVN